MSNKPAHLMATEAQTEERRRLAGSLVAITGNGSLGSLARSLVFMKFKFKGVAEGGGMSLQFRKKASAEY